MSYWEVMTHRGETISCKTTFTIQTPQGICHESPAGNVMEYTEAAKAVRICARLNAAHTDEQAGGGCT